MKLASYKGTRPGLQGIVNRLIRWRFDGLHSHTEVVFEPTDDVSEFMPDWTTQPHEDGALWCASSVAVEVLPSWSPKRPGKAGGVRFKRIVLDPEKWDVIPYPGDAKAAAKLFHEKQGTLYNWELCLKYVAFFMPMKDDREACSQVSAAAGGFNDAWRFDPCTLHVAVSRLTPVQA